MKVFKFYPEHRAKFHFGERNGGLAELISSDQLFSALYNCAILLYGSGEDNKAVQALSKLTLSSLQPGIQFLNCQDNKKTELFFLPRPLGPINPLGGYQDLLHYKKIKNISYLSLEAFKLLKQSWQPGENFFNFDLLKLATIGGKFAFTQQERENLGLSAADLNEIKLFTSEAKPKVEISRSDNHSENFYFQEEMEVVFQKSGSYLVRPFMYFLCDGLVNQEITAAVRLMADEGLGGKRSSGLGFLGTVEQENWSGELFAGVGRSYLSLSCIYPAKEEIDKLIYYELVERSGYLHSQYGRSLRKKRVRLLKEGTIFSDRISGQVLDISPRGFLSHPVYLNGKAFLVPIREV